MKLIGGYYGSYSYIAIYQDGDKEKTMEFVSEEEANEYFNERKNELNTDKQ